MLRANPYATAFLTAFPVFAAIMLALFAWQQQPPQPQLSRPPRLAMRSGFI